MQWVWPCLHRGMGVVESGLSKQYSQNLLCTFNGSLHSDMNTMCLMQHSLSVSEDCKLGLSWYITAIGKNFLHPSYMPGKLLQSWACYSPICTVMRPHFSNTKNCSCFRSGVCWTGCQTVFIHNATIWWVFFCFFFYCTFSITWSSCWSVWEACQLLPS